MRNRAAAIETMLRVAEDLDRLLVLAAIDLFDRYYAGYDVNQAHYVDDKKLTALAALHLLVKEDMAAPADIVSSLGKRLKADAAAAHKRERELVEMDIRDSYSRHAKLGYLERFIAGMAKILRTQVHMVKTASAFVDRLVGTVRELANSVIIDIQLHRYACSKIVAGLFLAAYEILTKC